MTTAIFPSILSAEFINLADNIKECESAGATGIHIDVMDGQFVPPITFGPLLVKSIKPITNLILDIHMMVANPGRYFDELATAGADSVSFHFESSENILSDLNHLLDLGISRSLAINPETSIDEVKPFIPNLDQILIMSVKPGYGGQKFISDSLSKINSLKKLLQNEKSSIKIQVDGGINIDTVAQVVSAGADSIVVGSAVFNLDNSITKNVKSILSVLNDKD